MISPVLGSRSTGKQSSAIAREPYCRSLLVYFSARFECEAAQLGHLLRETPARLIHADDYRFRTQAPPALARCRLSHDRVNLCVDLRDDVAWCFCGREDAVIEDQIVAL